MSEGLGDRRRGDGEATGLAGGAGRGRLPGPPERRPEGAEAGAGPSSVEDCRSWLPLAYTKVATEGALVGFGRDVSTSEEVVDRASEAWKKRGEVPAMSVKEFGREICCPSAVRVFALKLLDCSGFTPRAGLRSVRRGAARPNPTGAGGWE